MISDCLPTLKIHRAYIEMRDVMCQTESMTIMSEMYNDTNWNENSDWSTVAQGHNTHYMASMPINYNKGNGYTEKHRYSISVLDAVKYWVAEANNTSNYHHESPQGGIMIRAYDAVEQGSTPIMKYFASSQYAASNFLPSLAITYYDVHTQYSDPFGHLDAVTRNSIRGWVWCVDLPGESVPVTIYLKNKTTGKDYPPITLEGKDTALHRRDVEDAGYGTGCYGFNYPINWNEYSAGVYEVRAKWHSMNGTTLQSDLFNGPREYVNSGVRLSEQNLTLEIGDTTTLTATTYIDGESNLPIMWMSNDESVATVNNGVVTAVNQGTTNILALYNEEQYVSCIVEVKYGYFDNSETSNIKSEFVELLGEKKLDIPVLDLFYIHSTEKCIDIIVDNDYYITKIANELKLEKAFIQTIIMRELWCLNLADDVGDGLVQSYYNWKESCEDWDKQDDFYKATIPYPTPPVPQKDDSSVGLGQIFARVAIAAYNHAIDSEYIGGTKLNSDDWHECRNVWYSLKDDDEYNIRMTSLNILSCIDEFDYSHNYDTYSADQCKHIFTRYNANTHTINDYGQECYQYYLIFKKYI